MNQKSILIYGPMFAGKSEKLICLYQNDPSKNILIFKPKLDIRTQEVFSRTGKTIKAIVIETWSDILNYIKKHKQDINSIYVDESQFVTDDNEDFKTLFNLLKQRNIDIIVSTLDKDFLGNNFVFFEKNQELFSNHIVLSSICNYCEQMAFYTNKIRNDKLVITYDNLFDIDRKTKNLRYVPVCSLHNLKNNS